MLSLYVRKTYTEGVGIAHEACRLKDFRWEQDTFRCTYGDSFENINVKKENGYYLLKFDNKYFTSVGHWIRPTENYSGSSYYVLEKNNDNIINIPDTYYVKDKNTGQYICMDEYGWFNIKNDGKYLLVMGYGI